MEKMQSFIFTKIFKVQSLKQIQCVNINLLEYFETRYQILTITGKMTDVLHHRLHCCIYSFFLKHQFLLISGMQPVKHTFLRLMLLDTWQKLKILTYCLWEMLATWFLWASLHMLNRWLRISQVVACRCNVLIDDNNKDFCFKVLDYQPPPGLEKV